MSDLDETRRLLLMALVSSQTKRYNLAGTLINALLYHQGLDMDRDELVRRVTAAVDGNGDQADRAWLWEQIDQVTARLKAGQDA